MAFCKNCGNQLAEGMAYCPACGTKVDVPVQTEASAQAETSSQTEPFVQTEASDQTETQYQQVPRQPAAQAEPTGDADVQQNKGIAWLSYLGLLLLIPLFARKNSEYCQYHVKQGANLLAVNIAFTLASQILLAVIDAVFPGGWIFYFYYHSTIYNIFNFIFMCGYIFLAVIAIIGIVNAASGKKKELFLVGKIPFIAPLMDKIYAALNK